MIQVTADDAGVRVNFHLQQFGGLTNACRARYLQRLGMQRACRKHAGLRLNSPACSPGPDDSIKFLRCVLANRDMLSVMTAEGPFDIVDGRITAPTVPGLGISPRMDVLGEPVASYS